MRIKYFIQKYLDVWDTKKNCQTFIVVVADVRFFFFFFFRKIFLVFSFFTEKSSSFKDVILGKREGGGI